MKLHRSRRPSRLLALLLMVLALLVPAAAIAHKGEKHGQAQAVQQAPSGSAVAGSTATGSPGHGAGMMPGMAMDMNKKNMPFLERLFSWFGRLHPLIVHFPIAFFPAALLTAVVGRRRPSFAAPVQFLVVSGGVFAPIAAGAGLLAALDADPDAILTYHRILGLVVGAFGAGLALWAWKRPWEDRGAGMIAALTLMTVMIAVQGFLGAAITHGFDHLMF